MAELIVADVPVLLTVVQAENRVEISSSGPQGAPGPTGAAGADGAPGAAGGGYTFTQSSPASSWTVRHNLGRYPNVSYVDDDGRVSMADVQHLNVNTLVLEFPNPVAGKAVCS